MALIALIAVPTVPAFRTLLLENDLVLSTLTISAAARQAELNARAVRFDSPWGIQITTSSVTIFNGNTYASRVVEHDTVLALPKSVTPAGNSEIVFVPFSGTTSSSTIELNQSSGRKRFITISTIGVIGL